MQKRKLKEATFKAGDKATVVDYGTMSNKVVTVVDQKEIKTDGRGVPINVSGAYKEPNYKTHVPVKTRDGKFSLIPKKSLKKNEPKQESRESMRKFRTGDKVTITMGVNRNRPAVVVDRSLIKLSGRGIPTNVPGAYDQPNWTNDIPIRFEDGTFDLVAKRFLKLISNESKLDKTKVQEDKILISRKRLKEGKGNSLEVRLKRLEEAIGENEDSESLQSIADRLQEDEEFMSLRTREQLIWLESQEDLDISLAKQVLKMIEFD